MVPLINRSKWHSSRLTRQQQDTLYAGKDKLNPAIYLGAVTTSAHKEIPLTRHRSQCQRSTMEYSKKPKLVSQVSRVNLVLRVLLTDTQE